MLPSDGGSTLLAESVIVRCTCYENTPQSVAARRHRKVRLGGGGGGEEEKVVSYLVCDLTAQLYGLTRARVSQRDERGRHLDTSYRR